MDAGKPVRHCKMHVQLELSGQLPSKWYPIAANKQSTLFEVEGRLMIDDLVLISLNWIPNYINARGS